MRETSHEFHEKREKLVKFVAKEKGIACG